MLIKVSILLTVCSMLLISCSVSKVTNESLSLQYPTLANVSLYRSDSIKPQPELISAQSDAKLLEAAVKEIQAAAPPTTIPAAQKIDAIFYFQFSYETKGSAKAEDYMYVSDIDGNYFIKSFKMMSRYSIDNYDEKEKELLLQDIGYDGWQPLASPLLIIMSPAKSIADSYPA